jgi:hypothetical protein
LPETGFPHSAGFPSGSLAYRLPLLSGGKADKEHADRPRSKDTRSALQQFDYPRRQTSKNAGAARISINGGIDHAAFPITANDRCKPHRLHPVRLVRSGETHRFFSFPAKN